MNLQLGDNSEGETGINMFRGVDLYRQYVRDETKRSKTYNLIAIKSFFGLLLEKKNVIIKAIGQLTFQDCIL